MEYLCPLLAKSVARIYLIESLNESVNIGQRVGNIYPKKAFSIIKRKTSDSLISYFSGYINKRELFHDTEKTRECNQVVRETL